MVCPFLFPLLSHCHIDVYNLLIVQKIEFLLSSRSKHLVEGVEKNALRTFTFNPYSLRFLPHNLSQASSPSIHIIIFRFIGLVLVFTLHVINYLEIFNFYMNILINLEPSYNRLVNLDIERGGKKTKTKKQGNFPSTLFSHQPFWDVPGPLGERV